MRVLEKKRENNRTERQQQENGQKHSRNSHPQVHIYRELMNERERVIKIDESISIDYLVSIGM